MVFVSVLFKTKKRKEYRGRDGVLFETYSTSQTVHLTHTSIDRGFPGGPSMTQVQL